MSPSNDFIGLHRRLTRRSLLASMPSVALLAVLAACGSDDNTSPTTASSSGSSGAATPATSGATPSNVTPAPSAGASPAANDTDDSPWSMTDDRGVTVELPRRPTRIVAQTTAAASLWDFGIKVVGIYGPGRLPDGSADFQAGNVDLDAVEYLGDYGEIDLEKLVALDADLYVDLALYGDQLWYAGDGEANIKAIVPTFGISMQKVSMLDSIKRFEELAVSLGADLSAPDVVQAKQNFDAAQTELKAAISGNPDLTVLVTSPTQDTVYIASPRWMTDLFYFHNLGLDIVDHDTDQDDFFKQISWEQLANYPADLILVDQRTPGIMDELAGITIWNTQPAVKAGQTGPWYAAAPYSYGRIVPILQEMTKMISESKADVV